MSRPWACRAVPRCKRGTTVAGLLLFVFASPWARGQSAARPASAMYDPNLHLFVDNSEIQRFWQMSRILGTPVRNSRPLITADKPWEMGPNRLILNYGGFGSVIYDPQFKKFRMWYSALNGQPDPDFP